MRPDSRLLLTFFIGLLLLSVALGQAQFPATPRLPDDIQPAYAVLKAEFPKFEAKRFPKPPADSVWIFRSARMSDGNVEVGFEGKDVVYMIFRRGAGGESWKSAEIRALHHKYARELLQEEYDPQKDTFSRYTDTISKQINAGLIVRKDFDTKAILSGL